MDYNKNFVICSCGMIVKKSIHEKHLKTKMHEKLKKWNVSLENYVNDKSKWENKKFDYDSD